MIFDKRHKYSELQKHLASKHEGKKKEFCCDLCLADFSRSENLDFHIATVHEGKKPFKCHDCNSNFSRNAELTKHRIINHEGNLLQCQLCDFTGNYFEKQ